jgi:hypothetical protein
MVYFFTQLEAVSLTNKHELVPSPLAGGNFVV